jgi:hypothetical protein
MRGTGTSSHQILTIGRHLRSSGDFRLLLGGGSVAPFIRGGRWESRSALLIVGLYILGTHPRGAVQKRNRPITSDRIENKGR